MTRLSVNINKVATLRNARGGNNPNVLQVALDCERFGAQGITVHPRPDERHITKKDVYEIYNKIGVEFNIEGYPDERFMAMVKEIRPAQATLVPDPPGVLTSNAGWDTVIHHEKLSNICDKLSSWGVRVSIFVDPDTALIKGAKKCGADNIELYTGPYAHDFIENPEKAVLAYVLASKEATALNLGINAGHDLDLANMKYLIKSINNIDEVSIGHAIICDALYYGLENTIQMYLRKLDLRN
jgi:pyridoxine 5-phosphate synthase